MRAEPRVGLLGGTLDPIHVGHVETACVACRALDLERAYVIPSNVPPHRAEQPIASPFHRFAMTALAVNELRELEASDLELSTPGPSYTTDTLTRFSRTTGLSTAQIFFITGADAFAEIETWYRYPDVLDLANFVVISRPAFPVEDLRRRLPRLATRMVSVPALPQRPLLGETRSGSVGIFLVDAQTPDVSSTEIRKHLHNGRSINGLVPDAVERHITKHGLYIGNASFAGRPLA